MKNNLSSASAAKTLLILVLSLIPAINWATESTPVKDLPDRISAIETLNDQINQVVEMIGREDWAAALPLMKRVIEAPAFEYLPLDRRRALLTSASGVAFTLDDYKLAQTYAIRACALPDPSPHVFQIRLYASFYLDDWPDAAQALMYIAKTPKALAAVNDDVIFRIINELKKSATNAATSFDLMAALYAASWKIDGIYEPSYVWRDYAIALIERQRTAEAKKSLLRIQQPSSLISIRVDKRFGPIFKSSPEIFDIDKAVNADIGNLRKLMRESPRSMLAVMQLTYALLKARRYDEVLSLTNDVMQKMNEHAGTKPAYDDGNEKFIWILNNRAIALGGLGRRDEELELLVRAARRPEHGEPNVSQAINLGEFYCELGRPKDALFAILDVEKTSPYGKSQMELVHLCAGLQLEDKEAVASALNYLKEHQADSPRTYQGALIDVQDFDGAAAILIGRLNDPSLRADALVEVQNYIDPTDLPWPTKSREHFRTVINRDDVQNAIQKVGRIESFNLRSDLN